MTLQRRLLLLILAIAPVIWAVAAAGAWWSAQHEIDELYDTELDRFARQVLAVLPPTLDAADRAALSPQPAGERRGEAELHTLSVSAWIGERRVPHPLPTLSEAIRLQHGEPRGLPRTYVRCTRREGLVQVFGADPLQPMFEKAVADGFEILTIDSGHDAMVIAPGDVARALLAAAGSGARDVRA